MPGTAMRGQRTDQDAPIRAGSSAYSSSDAIEPGNVPGWAQEVLPVLGVGPAAPLWVSLAVADWGVKIALALAALIPFRVIVSQAMRQREVH